MSNDSWPVRSGGRTIRTSPRIVMMTTPDNTNPHFSPRQTAAKLTTKMGAEECNIVLSPILKYFCAQVDASRAIPPITPRIYTMKLSYHVTTGFNLITTEFMLKVMPSRNFGKSTIASRLLKVAASVPKVVYRVWYRQTQSSSHAFPRLCWMNVPPRQ